jgi:hypothetical protein
VSPRWNEPTWVHVAAALVVGVLVTATISALVWPEPAAEPEVAVTAPPVPESPEVAPLEELSEVPTEPTPAPEDTTEPDEPDEQEEQEEPTEAALLPDARPAGEGPLPSDEPVDCPDATLEVADGASLQAALDVAGPGEVIALADGRYEGHFVATESGSSTEPVYLCGSPDAVLDGGSVEEDGYTLHLDGAQHWRLVGFSVTGGQKGVMADGTVGSVIQGLTVSGVGDEAVHLRSNSTDNLVLGNAISDTGLREQDYGEGIYIGSAVSNWCTYTECEPDRSDRNVVKGNTISATTSEPIDVKEGTTGGVLIDNVLDGSAMTEADTWVNLKGNNYLVQGNRGTSASENGFETHDILPGWGDFNVFRANTGSVDGSGYGIASWPEGSNVVDCSNRLGGTAEGLSNIACT